MLDIDETTENAPRCILWGGYAGGNTGDELTLAVALRDARNRFADRVAVLSCAPTYTQWLFPDVRVIPFLRGGPPGLPPTFRKRCLQWRRRGWLPDPYRAAYRVRALLQGKRRPPPPWMQAIVGARELCLVGGGYLTDLFDLDYFLLPVWTAKSAAVPVRAAPLGLGPFRSKRAEALVSDALRGATLQVRDERSYAFCRRHGISATLRLDDGLRAAEVIDGLQPPRQRTGSATAAVIGVCISNQPGSADPAAIERWCADMLRALQARGRAVEVRGFCFHTRTTDDFENTVRIFRRAGLNARNVQPPNLDFRVAIRDLARYDAIVSTRFHAVVAAQLHAVPAIAVAAGEYYAAKTNSLLNRPKAPVRVVDPAHDRAEDVARYTAAYWV